MGTVVVAGERAIVTTRMHDRTEWRQMKGTDWYERTDAGAPIAPERAVVLTDPREDRAFALEPTEVRRG